MLEKIECPTLTVGLNIRIPAIYKPLAGERGIFESVPFILCRYTVPATIRNQIDFSLIVYSILRICKVFYIKCEQKFLAKRNMILIFFKKSSVFIKEIKIKSWIFQLPPFLDIHRCFI